MTISREKNIHSVSLFPLPGMLLCPPLPPLSSPLFLLVVSKTKSWLACAERENKRTTYRRPAVHRQTMLGGVAALLGVLVSQGSWESWPPAPPTGIAESPPMAASPSPSSSSRVGDDPARKGCQQDWVPQWTGTTDAVRSVHRDARLSWSWVRILRLAVRPRLAQGALPLF